MKKLVPILALTVCTLTAQSGGYVGGPTDAELWKGLAKQWRQVTAAVPEALPKDTPRKDAQNLIDKADAARGAYLRLKESLYLNAAAQLTGMAALLSPGDGEYDSREIDAPAAIKARIAELDELLSSLGNIHDQQSSAEAAAIRSVREGYQKLLSAVEDSSAARSAKEKDAMTALLARQRAVSELNSTAARFKSLASSVEDERRLWHEYYTKLPERFCGKDDPCNVKP